MRKGTPSFPAPANFKNTDHPLTPHLPSSPFLFKREPAQGQGLTGAGTPRDEFLRGFISSKRHKDQAPAAAGVTYGFPHACQPPAHPPGAEARGPCMYIDVTAAEV